MRNFARFQGEGWKTFSFCLNCSGRNRDVGLEPQLHLNIYISLDSISFRFPCGAIYMLMNPRNNSWIKTRFLSKKHMDLEQSCVAASYSNALKLKGINIICRFYSFSRGLFWTNSFCKSVGLKRGEKKGISDNNSKYWHILKLMGLWELWVIRLRPLCSTVQVVYSPVLYLLSWAVVRHPGETLFSFTKIWYFMENIKQQGPPIYAGNGFWKTKSMSHYVKAFCGLS